MERSDELVEFEHLLGDVAPHHRSQQALLDMNHCPQPSSFGSTAQVAAHSFVDYVAIIGANGKGTKCWSSPLRRTREKRTPPACHTLPTSVNAPASTGGQGAAAGRSLGLVAALKCSAFSSRASKESSRPWDSPVNNGVP